jgi:hypothetical protein
MAKIPLELLSNVKHWQDRAEKARVHADQISDPEARRMMLDVAASYDKLANRAEQRKPSGTSE